MAKVDTNSPMVRRILFLCFSFSFRIFLAGLHAASRAHRSCHSVSSWDRSSNFEALGLIWRWSPGQFIPSDGFWSGMLAWRNTAYVNRTHRIGFRKFELFPQNRCRLRRLHILKYATQLSCTFQHCHCNFSPFFLKLLARLFSSTWRCAYEHLFPNLHPFSDL